MTAARTKPERYIWIPRWERFQHYAPERDRTPVWIKDYTKQLDDDDYRRLSTTQRGLLHDLRIAFAKSNGNLSADTRELSQRLGERVVTASLTSLCQAGLLELVSIKILEKRLETFYKASSPRARGRMRGRRRSKKKNPPTPISRKSEKANPQNNGTRPYECPVCGIGLKSKRSLDQHMERIHESDLESRRGVQA